MIYLRSTLALSALVTFAAFAQPVPLPPPHEGMIQFQASDGPGNFVFSEAKVMAESGFDGKLVKGAPYSAQAVTETTQVLANGTRISRKNSSSIARDSEGRTRREETLSSVGPWSTDGQSHTMVFINDPVGRNNYVLDPARHSANKLASRRVMMRRPAPGGDVTAAEAARAKQKDETAATAYRQKELANTRVESLGTQTIAGVAAVGTRRTRTIPAGQIGNDQPIDMVSETWYSEELQMIVMSKHSDPRSGETIYMLTNLQRSEPDAALFVLPVDYTVQDNSQQHVFLQNKTTVQ
ncbi:MAG: hypothetical protein ACR2NN_27655 [Bryobacteraceae bacterium]